MTPINEDSNHELLPARDLRSSHAHRPPQPRSLGGEGEPSPHIAVLPSVEGVARLLTATSKLRVAHLPRHNASTQVLLEAQQRRIATLEAQVDSYADRAGALHMALEYIQLHAAQRLAIGVDPSVVLAEVSAKVERFLAQTSEAIVQAIS